MISCLVGHRFDKCTITTAKGDRISGQPWIMRLLSVCDSEEITSFLPSSAALSLILLAVLSSLPFSPSTSILLGILGGIDCKICFPFHSPPYKPMFSRSYLANGGWGGRTERRWESVAHYTSYYCGSHMAFRKALGLLQRRFRESQLSSTILHSQHQSPEVLSCPKICCFA